jgi:hypothetical protein
MTISAPAEVRLEAVDTLERHSPCVSKGLSGHPLAPAVTVPPAENVGRYLASDIHMKYGSSSALRNDATVPGSRTRFPFEVSQTHTSHVSTPVV